jgi:hypothetical protein
MKHYDPLEATERLAASYPSREAEEAVWRGARKVREEAARSATSDDERLRHARLAVQYELREELA